jgi:hypothetical protein
MVIPLMTAHDPKFPIVRARIAHETKLLALNFWLVRFRDRQTRQATPTASENGP